MSFKRISLLILAFIIVTTTLTACEEENDSLQYDSSVTVTTSHNITTPITTVPKPHGPEDIYTPVSNTNGLYYLEKDTNDGNINSMDVSGEYVAYNAKSNSSDANLGKLVVRNLIKKTRIEVPIGIGDFYEEFGVMADGSFCIYDVGNMVVKLYNPEGKLSQKLELSKSIQASNGEFIFNSIIGDDSFFFSTSLGVYKVKLNTTKPLKCELVFNNSDFGKVDMVSIFKQVSGNKFMCDFDCYDDIFYFAIVDFDNPKSIIKLPSNVRYNGQFFFNNIQIPDNNIINISSDVDITQGNAIVLTSDAEEMCFVSSKFIATLESDFSSATKITYRLYEISSGKLISQFSSENFSGQKMDSNFNDIFRFDERFLMFYTTSESNSSLVLWDTQDSSGVNDTRTKLKTEIRSIDSLIIELESKIEAYSSFDIYYGDEGVLPTYATGYESAPVTDKQQLLRMLNSLNKCLSKYPPKLLKEIDNSNDGRFAVFLCAKLIGKNAGTISAANGLKLYYDNRYVIISCDTSSDGTKVYAHELMHIIEEIMYSKYPVTGENEAFKYWDNFNPENFAYYNSYVDSNGHEIQFSRSEYTTQAMNYNGDINSVYFVSPYSLTFALEDRAQIMENLFFFGDNFDTFKSSKMQSKAMYLCAEIRRVFNIQDDEKLYWERGFAEKIPNYKYYYDTYEYKAAG